MNFKKSKEEVIMEAIWQADGAFRNHMYASMGQYPYPPYGQPSYHPDPHNFMNLMAPAISMAIGEAIRSMVDNIYTDADFEKDIGLVD